jgi:hypothetical protein
MTPLRLLSAVLFLLALAAGCASDDTGEPLDTDLDAGLSEEPAFMEPCDVDDDRCAEDTFCFGFNSRGPHCTHECTGDEQCAAPSPGCTNMGLCKAP